MSAVPGKPDVIMILVDQLSARWLEAGFAGAVTLPNLKRLRARGMMFRQAFSTNPVCCPARATIATGLSTLGHGVLENGYQLDPALPTFMRSLQQAGWRTGAFGKVHFHPHFAGLHPDYRPFGFDVTHITEDPRGGEWLDWIRREHPQWEDAALGCVWCANIPEFSAYGTPPGNLTERIHAIRSKNPDNGVGGYTLPFPAELSQTEWITQHAISFIRETPKAQPLFAHIGYVQPHGPSCPPEEYLSAVDETRIPEALHETWVDDPNHPSTFSLNRKLSPEMTSLRRKLYFADLAHLDAQVGRIFDALESVGRLETTYVLFLADHGEMLGDHGMWGKESRHYDACIRIPLIVTGPNIGRGVESDRLVTLEDICPSILDWTGTSLPTMPSIGPYLRIRPEAIPQLPGHSLMPICRGEEPSDWRTSVHSVSYNGLGSIDPREWARTLRTSDSRYTWYPAGGGEQLFDLQTDPQELRSLSGDPAFSELRNRLRLELLEAEVLLNSPKPRRNLFSLGVH